MSIIFFILGLFVGSFLLVVVDRLARDESFLVGRSHCDMCGHELSALDLIPIFSYMFLLGTCRYCHKSYGVQYPLFEIVCGLSFATIPFFFPNILGLQYAELIVLTSCFIVIFFCDLWYGFIPDGALLIAGLVTIPFVFLSPNEFFMHVLTGLCSFVLFLMLFFATKQKGIGFGDVKLAFVMGFLLGFPLIILGFYIAFLTGATVALILIIRKKQKFHGGTISFGPFLILGTYSSLCGGMVLWHFFMHLLFQL